MKKIYKYDQDSYKLRNKRYLLQYSGCHKEDWRLIIENNLIENNLPLIDYFLTKYPSISGEGHYHQLEDMRGEAEEFLVNLIRRGKFPLESRLFSLWLYRKMFGFLYTKKKGYDAYYKRFSLESDLDYYKSDEVRDFKDDLKLEVRGQLINNPRCFSLDLRELMKDLVEGKTNREILESGKYYFSTEESIRYRMIKIRNKVLENKEISGILREYLG